MSSRGCILAVVAAVGLVGCRGSHPSSAEVEHACLAVCKQVIPETAEVSVSSIRAARLPDGRFQVTARVSERRAGWGVFNGLGKPITVLFARRSGGWSAVSYDLMGTKGMLQQKD